MAVGAVGVGIARVLGTSSVLNRLPLTILRRT
jgi:hypothetical protein